MICNILEKCILDELNGISVKCPNLRVSCVEVSDSRFVVKCEEKGKRYSFQNENKKHTILYKVDGGIIKC